VRASDTRIDGAALAAIVALLLGVLLAALTRFYGTS